MEEESFEEVVKRVTGRCHEAEGIGTLKEKTLHAVLKAYIEPDTSRHEQKVDGFVVDILEDDGIVEIQTRNFYGMKKKLGRLLDSHKITIVYPIPNEKQISWLDPKSGEITGSRKSPKKPHPQEMAHELIHILPYLDHPNLSFRIMYIDVEDIKLLNGWDETKKKGAERYERIPKRLVSEKYIRSREDYSYFVPEGLTDGFTQKDFKKSAKITTSCAQRMLYILMKQGIVERTGRKGRAYIYSFCA